MSSLTILVSGMMAGTPNQGGAAWAVLQYVLGLKRLGHDVYFIETVDASSSPSTGEGLQESESASFLRRISEEFDLEGRTALKVRGSTETAGLTYAELTAAAGRADLLLNFSGVLKEPDLLDAIPVRVYVDLDPGFTQLWHDAHGIDMGFAGHTHFVTVGPAIGSTDCPIPDCGIEWVGTLQPVVLDQWPVAAAMSYPALTTIANWRGYGSIEYKGRFYGQKAHSLRQFIDLPHRTRERFLLALAIHPDETQDIEALRRNGWTWCDPAAVASTPGQYRTFVQGSKAEFGIAKSGYVEGQSGWFSDRSICYLASGRPVLAQETGFSSLLPTGEGLLPFRTVDDVLDGIDELNRDYDRHRRAARSIAEEYFDSDRVLKSLLERLGSGMC